MSIKIGNFHAQNQSDELAELNGHIKTMEFEADMRIVRGDPPNNPNAPTHSVSARSPKGNFIEVGAAWTKKIIRGSNAGNEFLSVTIDDPSFQHTLYFSAFQGENGQWDAVWSRPKANAA